MRLMITGHRPQRLNGNEILIKKWINDKIKELQPTECISGMAEGADTIFAEVSLENHIPLAAYLPFNQELKGKRKDILDRATVVKIVCDEWSKQCYTIRDKAMVDDSDVVLVVWDGKPGGGTYWTMEYAKKQGREIYILNV